MIAIIDYGVGNLRNVEKAIQYVGAEVVVTSDVELLRKADALVLPGVGAFEEAMSKLHKSGTVAVITDAIRKDKPLLGICLGMQMLFDYSEEGSGKISGLGIFGGEVKKFQSTMEQNKSLKIPQIGWNSINMRNHTSLFEGIREEEYFYFVHSFYVKSRDRHIVSATAEYGLQFDAAIGTGNVFATQFHPEKSGTAGLKVLSNFLRITNEEKEKHK